MRFVVGLIPCRTHICSDKYNKWSPNGHVRCKYISNKKIWDTSYFWVYFKNIKVSYYVNSNRLSFRFLSLSKLRTDGHLTPTRHRHGRRPYGSTPLVSRRPSVETFTSHAPTYWEVPGYVAPTDTSVSILTEFPESTYFFFISESRKVRITHTYLVFGRCHSVVFWVEFRSVLQSRSFLCLKIRVYFLKDPSGPVTWVYPNRPLVWHLRHSTSKQDKSSTGLYPFSWRLRSTECRVTETNQIHR